MRSKAIIAFLSIVLAWPAGSSHAISHSVIISQLQTGGAGGAGQEFVELYNPTVSDVSVDGWTVQYKSAASADETKSWTVRAHLSGSIKSHGFYLTAPKAYLSEADADFSEGLAAAGGQVRLIDQAGLEFDRLGWGTGNAAEGAAATEPKAGQSLTRINATDSDNNAADFAVSQAEPRFSASPVQDPASWPGPTAPAADSSSQPTGSPDQTAGAVSGPVEITELLIDPAKPLTDANDEFIELHNPGFQTVDLTGFKLETGKNFGDHYTLPATSLAGGQYLVLYSAQTHLALTNYGGAARLVDQAGQVVSQTPDYDSAEPGQSWAEFDDAWHWTIQTTPGVANILVSPILSAAKTKAMSSASKTSSAKAKASSTKSASGTKAKAAAKPKLAAASTTAADPAAASSHWLLIGVAGLTIGYALYEYRYDLRNCFHLAGRKLGLGRKVRPASAGRAHR